MKYPIEVICPKCHAAVGYKCLARVPRNVGWKAVEYFHRQRVEKAKEQ